MRALPASILLIALSGPALAEAETNAEQGQLVCGDREELRGAVRVEPGAARLVDMLYRSHPQPAPAWLLAERLYGGSVNPRNALRRAADKAREALAPLGLHVVNDTAGSGPGASTLMLGDLLNADGAKPISRVPARYLTRSRSDR